MEGGGDMSAIWAALQAADDGLARAAPAHGPRGSGVYAVAGFTDDAADEEEDEEDEEEDDDEMAPVMPQRVAHSGGGGAGAAGLLPPSFYAASSSALPDVVPAFLLPAHRPYAGEAAASAGAAHHTTTTTGTSSEAFLDDILRSHDEPFGAQRLTAERLSQLEDNYERKKKRAKINRRDLNSRFQELMELLRLKEDRKLNRAKVLEKAIEQIHKLTDELSAARLALQRHAAAHSAPQPPPGAPPGAPPFHGAGLPLQMPLPMPQWTPGVNMAATQMMWMPMLPPQPVSRPSSARARTSTKTARASTARATVSMQTQTSPERPSATTTTATAVAVRRRPGLKRGREATTSGTSDVSVSSTSLVWIAQEVPALLELCDAWTLRELLCVSPELHTAAKRDALWQKLCERRWRLDPAPMSSLSSSLALWTQLDAANEMPRCFCVTGATVAFASGRHAGVALWASLVRRSNGRTTRTVLVDGKAVVRQVVELNVVVQNLDVCASLKLTNALRVGAIDSTRGFEMITSDSRAHLAPHLVTVNDVPRGTTSVAGVELFHGDFCVLSVFVACDGLDLEQQFLDRVEGVEMECERGTYGRHSPMETLRVAARACHDKQTRIADAYGATATTSDGSVSSSSDKSP